MRLSKDTTRVDTCTAKDKLSTQIVEAWRREYSEERPKKYIGGLNPGGPCSKADAKPVKLTLGL